MVIPQKIQGPGIICMLQKALCIARGTGPAQLGFLSPAEHKLDGVNLIFERELSRYQSSLSTGIGDYCYSALELVFEAACSECSKTSTPELALQTPLWSPSISTSLQVVYLLQW